MIAKIGKRCGMNGISILAAAAAAASVVSGCAGGTSARIEQAVPEAHRLKTVMGRDYWTLLYSYFFNNSEWNAWAARDPQQRAYDNPELRKLAVFRDCALRDFSCRRPPDVATGLAAYRTVKENFYSGNGHWEGMEACVRPDHPLQVTFAAKRSPLALAGKLDYDFDDFAKWKARHPNLTVFHTLSEWDNDVNHNIAYAFGKPKTNAVEEARRQAVRAFIGAIPSNRYDRVKLQRKYFDRQVELYYGDREHIGALHCSVLIGNLAAAWGAREIQLETTNTTSPGDNEYRWEIGAMFARGAARQFGIPWGWYTAIFMNGFNAADGKFVGDSVCGYPKRPEGGVSRSLNRRCWYYAYLNGANSVEQEGWHAVFLTRDASGKAVLSPRGEDFAAYHDFTAAHPDRGVPYTPVAVLVPFAQGYTSEGGYPWRNSRYGYTAGDQTVDAVFFSIVPGFERGAAMRKGGEFNLHNTQMAMMYDAISPDAPQKSGDLLATFRSYKALVVTGDYPDRAFERTLNDYEREGGRVIRIDPHSLPPVGKGTVGEIWSGRRAFPEVAAKLRALQDELFPVKVSGDCQYGLNRTKSGWWLWCFNNRGVTKFADREQVVDPSAASPVTVDLGKIRAKSVRELLSAREVPLSDGSFSHVIPAGDLAVFEIGL